MVGAPACPRRGRARPHRLAGPHGLARHPWLLPGLEPPAAEDIAGRVRAGDRRLAPVLLLPTDARTPRGDAPPVADLSAVLPHPHGDHSLAALRPASGARDHDLRGAQRGHPGGPDRHPRGVLLLRQESMAEAGRPLVERDRLSDSPQRRRPRPALDAVALPRLPHRSARHLHRRLALYLAARLPCPPRLAPPRGVHHPTPPLLENSRRGRTRQAW